MSSSTWTPPPLSPVRMYETKVFGLPLVTADLESVDSELYRSRISYLESSRCTSGCLLLD